MRGYFGLIFFTFRVGKEANHSEWKRIVEKMEHSLWWHNICGQKEAYKVVI